MNADKARVCKTEELVREGAFGLRQDLSVISDYVRRCIQTGEGRDALIPVLKQLLEDEGAPDDPPALCLRLRKFAAWRLARLGAKKAVPEIAALLRHSESRHIAAVSLGLLNTPEARAILRAHLAENESTMHPMNRHAFLVALSRDASQAAELNRRYGDDPNWAIRALVRNCHVDAGSVCHGLADPEPQVRRDTALAAALRLPVLPAGCQAAQAKALAKEVSRDARLAMLLLARRAPGSQPLREMVIRIATETSIFEGIYARIPLPRVAGPSEAGSCGSGRGGHRGRGKLEVQ